MLFRLFYFQIQEETEMEQETSADTAAEEDLAE